MLKDKIDQKKAIVGLIGVGYIGGELGKACAKAGFEVIGFDIKPEKVKDIKDFKGTSNPDDLKTCDILTINVPTPIDKSSHADFGPVKSGAKIARDALKKGQLVILESTVSPGTMREVVMPILEERGLKGGQDFYVGYSSERIDFGNEKYDFYSIPKVIAGLDETSLEMMDAFYSQFVKTTVKASTLEVGEMSKVLENTFRFVNICFITEMMAYASARGIDLWEVIEVAATKPFSFLKHTPSAGIGGHCIPVDPYYIIDDAHAHHVRLGILEEVAKFHENRASEVCSKALELAKTKTPKILLIGVTVKADSPDIRESAAEKIWNEAEKQGAEVVYHDPIVPNFHKKASQDLTAELCASIDVIIIVTDHKGIDWNLIKSAKKPILDCRNVYKGQNHHVIQF